MQVSFYVLIRVYDLGSILFPLLKCCFIVSFHCILYFYILLSGGVFTGGRAGEDILSGIPESYCQSVPTMLSYMD